MISAIPQPDPLALPAPVWLLWGLLILTFTLHLLAMNLVLGGSIVGAFTRLAARRGGAGTGNARLAAWIAKAMPVLVATAVTLGVAALLFEQVLYGRLFFVSAALMAWFWFAVIPLLLVAYYGAYALAFRREALDARAVGLAFGIALLFALIGLVYTHNMSLMLRPFDFVALYRADPRGLHLAWQDPAVVPRFLHMLLGAVAVAGLGIMGHGLRVRTRDAAFGAWAIRRGALWFSVATAANLLAGFVWLAMLPRDTTLRFMGANPAATIVLALGMTLGLTALAVVFMAAAAERPVPLARTGIGLALATLVLMVLTRDAVRQAALDAAGFRPVAWVAPQWGPIAVFALLLVAAVATVAWMAVALARGRGRAAA
jgi:hypothetical protein